MSSTRLVNQDDIEADTPEVTTGCCGKKVFVIEDHPKTQWGQIKAFLLLCFIVSPWIADAATWQTQFNTRTPFLQSLGLSEYWSSQVWISGPVMGFIVAPIVGTYSDCTTSILGRRRPFFIWGTALLAVSQLLLAWSSDIFSSHTAAIALAIPMQLLGDAALNIMQTPLRALGSDIAPPSKQFTAQLLAVCFQGIGQLIGFWIQKYTYHSPGEVNVLYTWIFAMSAFCFATVCVFVTEKPLTQVLEKPNPCKPFSDIFVNMHKMETRLVIVGVIQFFSWFAEFSYIPVASTWMAVSVYKGCPTAGLDGCTQEGAANYQRGLENFADMGIYGNIIQTVFALILSCWMYTSPPVNKVRVTYAVGLLGGSIACMLAKFGPQTEELGNLVAVLMYIPYTIIWAFPFAIVGKYCTNDGGLDLGAQFGLLNIFIVVPQLCATFTVSFFRNSLGDTVGLPWIMFLAGVSFVFAAIASLFVHDYSHESDRPAEVDTYESLDGEEE
mmetsp:Transcript_4986/g.7556  ORF Transcript_4986/g.7556 Transcript_4986/m.7556 type:complete len:497 (-) Transcript_4986:90-1580(-)|eukprot:CAMPEP_0203790232 /NCGR_PEP_ID=MMETSP0100_2-20121128/3926_1 /ASSEMBLY_ACC=CAM_ASM_000210 /TAXON_ID=96639 /ORGANISM=" , Strain NY0313808BC1" /LENGTH=496 /DNA_ID=CAMNT_0050693339 /DNA_START=687 /DNA_END=2177 /DNA_ORIENTATION=+